MPHRIQFSRAFVLVLLCLGCIYSQNISLSVKTGLHLCIEQLIPSLFLFLALANLYTPPIQKQNRILKMLHLPSGFMGMFFLTCIGGFPVGAACVQNVYSQSLLASAQAKKLSCIMVCCGPGFLLGFIANGLSAGAKAGWFLLISQLTVLLICLGIYSFSCRHDAPILLQNSTALPSSFSDSMFHSAKSMANICTTVLFICGIRGAITPLLIHLPQKITSIIWGLTEVASGCSGLHEFDYQTTLLLYAFFCSFGGFCVHLQIYGILKNKPSYFKFAGIRLLCAAANTAIFKLLTILSPIMPPDSACIALNPAIQPQSSTSSPVIFFLLLLTTLLFCASCITFLHRERTF